MNTFRAMGIIAAVLLCWAVATAAVPQEKEKNRAAMKTMIQALEQGDRASVASLLRYPVERTKPLKDLLSPSDFLSAYGDYFDESRRGATVRAIKVDLKRGNVRGTGFVLFGGGKVIAIEPIPERYEASLREAIVRDNEAIHPAARGYDRLAIDCRTNEMALRVERFGDKYKYFLWKNPEPLSTPPQETGPANKSSAGSAGVVSYTFASGTAAYELSSNQPVCSEEAVEASSGRCRATLRVTRGNQQSQHYCDTPR